MCEKDLSIGVFQVPWFRGGLRGYKVDLVREEGRVGGVGRVGESSSRAGYEFSGWVAGWTGGRRTAALGLKLAINCRGRLEEEQEVEEEDEEVLRRCGSNAEGKGGRGCKCIMCRVVSGVG